jgi:hypothetical protein
MICLFFLGVGGANFAVYTLWVPEQYRTECRASAFAFSTSVGRFVGAGITFLVGAGVRHFQTIGIPVALTSVAFAVGLLLIPFGEETRDDPCLLRPLSPAGLRNPTAPERGGSLARLAKANPMRSWNLYYLWEALQAAWLRPSESLGDPWPGVFAPDS